MVWLRALLFLGLPIAGALWLWIGGMGLHSSVGYAWLYTALLMTLVVFYGAGYRRMWRFHVPLARAGVVVQVGFIYAALVVPLQQGLWPWLLSLPWVYLLGMGVGGAGLGTVYDILLLRFGWLRVGPPRPGPVVAYGWRKAVRRSLSYGPRFFGFTGLLIGASVLIRHRWLQDWSLGAALTLLVPLGWLVFVGFFTLLTGHTRPLSTSSDSA